MRVNIGCGRTTTTGYKNLDNSLSLRLAKVPFLAGLLKRLRLIKKPQYDYIEFAQLTTWSLAMSPGGYRFLIIRWKCSIVRT